MKTLRYFLILSVIGLSSCDPNVVYQEFDKDFPDYQWYESKILEFKPEITDTAAKYNVYLELRHVYGFPFENFNVLVTLTSPSGVKIEQDYNYPVMGPEHKYLSDCAEDLCDLKTLIEENVKFTESGTYIYNVKHEMPVDPVPTVMEYGLIVEKVPPASDK